MTRKTTESLSRALGRRIARIGVAGAVVVAPVALAVPAHADTDWDRLAQCESSGDWGADTGNGFVGGLQFTPSTWKAFGGSGSADDASRSEQIAVAERVKAAQGMNAWPTCSKKTGQTSNSPNSDSDSGSDEDTSGGASTDDTSAGDAPTDREQAAAPQAETPAAPTTPAPATTHVVSSGETLSGIASRFDVAGGASALADRNDIADPDEIATGRTLAVG